MKLAARIAGVGLVGPGFDSWAQAGDVLAGRLPYASKPTRIPAADALPAVERRRAGKCVRLALAVGLAAAEAAQRAPKDLAAVFTSSTGDGENLHVICEALASNDREISPTRFHNSVHNAPAGYWGIATGAMGPSDSLAAYDASFGAGLVEAMARAATASQPVILIAYDAPYPEPLLAKRPLPDAFAVAMVIEAAPATISLEMGREAATPMADRALEDLRRSIPAARCLPLLERLARGGAGRVVLDYLDGASLAVELAP